MIKVKPITKTINGEIIGVYFDITIIIDKDNNAKIIDKDNYQEDWKDVVDSNVLVIKHVKINI